MTPVERREVEARKRIAETYLERLSVLNRRWADLNASGDMTIGQALGNLADRLLYLNVALVVLVCPERAPQLVPGATDEQLDEAQRLVDEALRGARRG